jgi:hypothetical protein
LVILSSIDFNSSFSDSIIYFSERVNLHYNAIIISMAELVVNAFRTQKAHLGGFPFQKTAEGAVGFHHPVAWHCDWIRVLMKGVAYRPVRVGPAYRPGDPFIGTDLSSGYTERGPVNGPLEFGKIIVL